MQQNLKLSLHGMVGTLFVVLLFGVAFLLGWNIRWGYLVTALVLYSGTVIALTKAEEKATQQGSVTTRLVIFRFLLGCHIALLLLILGLLIHFQDYHYSQQTIFGGTQEETAPSDVFAFIYFLASTLGGLAIPFLLLRISQNQNTLNPDGILGTLLIFLMLVIAYLYAWNISWWYFSLALIMYSAAIISLNLLTDFPPQNLSPPTFRSRLGSHLAFLLLVVGFLLHFQDEGVNVGFFIASIAGGLVIPYLLFRGS